MLLQPALILISQAPRSRRPCKLLWQPCGRFDPSIALATLIREEAELELSSTACSSAAQLVRATVFLITQNISHHSDGRCHPPPKARLARSASSWMCRYLSSPRTLHRAASSPYMDSFQCIQYSTSPSAMGRQCRMIYTSSLWGFPSKCIQLAAGKKVSVVPGFDFQPSFLQLIVNEGNLDK